MSTQNPQYSPAYDEQMQENNWEPFFLIGFGHLLKKMRNNEIGSYRGIIHEHFNNIWKSVWNSKAICGEICGNDAFSDYQL